MPRTFKFNPLYSGGMLCVPNNPHPVVLDIDGMELPTAGEAQIYHQDGWVAGKITRLWVDKNADGTPCICAEGEFDEDENGLPTPDACDVIGPVKIGGKKWECSIHTYKANPQDVEMVPAGVSFEANGKQFVGPTKRIRRSKFKEGSFVDMGGDAKNNVEIAAASAAAPSAETVITFSSDEIAASLAATNPNPQIITPTKGALMPPELKAYIDSLGYHAEDLTPEQIAIFEKCFNGPAAAPPADAPAAEAATETEKKPGEVAAQGEPPKPPDETAANIPPVDPDKKPGEEEEVMASRYSYITPNPARNLPRGQVSPTHGAPNINRVWEVAMMCNAGIMSPDEIKASGKFSDDEMTEGMRGHYAGATLVQMLAEAQERRTRRRYVGTEPGFAKDALTRMVNPNEIFASVAFSTMNELTIMQNVLNKHYRDGYEKFTSNIDKICSVSRTSNFRENKFVSYDIKDGSEYLPNGGEIINSTLVSDELVNQLMEYALIITITERMIIDDDLNAIAKLFRKMGQKERRQKEMRGFKKLLENLGTLFLATATDKHPGVNRVALPLGIEGLNKAAQLLAEQPTLGSTPDNPEFTEEDGRYLLVPKAMEATAKMLYKDTKCDLVGLGNEYLETNPHVGEYEPIVTSYIGSKYAKFGGSDAHAFLLGDPVNGAILDVVYLNGENGPRLEEVPTPGNILGKSFRSVYRYGFGLGDPRAAVMMTGAND